MLSETIKMEILGLKTVDKIQLVELILQSLDKPDPKIEEEWVKESERRYSLYKEGKIKATSADQVFNKLEEKWK